MSNLEKIILKGIIKVWEKIKELKIGNKKNAQICTKLGVIYGKFAQSLSEAIKEVSSVDDIILLVITSFEYYEKAEKEFREAIKINPNYFFAHYNLGNALTSLGRYKEAIQAYKKAIQIKSDSVEALYNLGVLYKFLKRYDEAREYFEKVLEIDPTDFECEKQIKSLDYLRNELN